MAAVDNKHLIEILAVNVQEGVSKKTGTPYKILKAQCVVRGPDQAVQVGELFLPKSMADTTPGKYLAEFELGVGYDREVIPLLTKLHAWSGDASAAGAGAAKPVARPAA